MIILKPSFNLSFTSCYGSFNSAPAVVQPPDIKVHENNTVVIQFDGPKDPENPEKPIKVRVAISGNMIIRYFITSKLFLGLISN